MKIVKATETHKESIKDLLVELQKYIVLIDEYHLNILTPKYRNAYFKKTWEECDMIYVALEDEKVVGVICGHLRKYDKLDRLDYTCPKVGVIEELIVTKNCRATGIGHKLIETIEQQFKKRHCLFVKVGVFAYNENAIKFYTKHNYKNRFLEMFKQL